MLWKLLEWANQGYTGVRVALFSEDYPTLEDRQISKIQREFPAWLGSIRTTKADGLGFYVAPEYGGGVLALRNLDDPSKYVGGEFAGIGIEELTRIQKSTFDLVRGSLRWPGITDTFLWAVTNPLGIGLMWVRDLWLERRFPPELQHLAKQFHFVKALPTDNPHLSQEYWEELRSQPAHIRRAWIDGDWYIPVGVMFEELHPETHFVPSRPLGAGTWVVLSCDWGYEHAAAALWIEVTESPQGRRYHVYREFITNHLTPVVWAEHVVRLTGNERVAIGWMDSAADSRLQDGSDSPYLQMLPTMFNANIALRKVSKQGARGLSFRKNGWSLLHEAFRVRDGEPALTVSHSCPALWRQLTTLVRGEPPHDIEDTAPGQTDDAVTALRYFVSMLQPGGPAATEEPAWDENRSPGFNVDGSRKERVHVTLSEDGNSYVREDGGAPDSMIPLTWDY